MSLTVFFIEAGFQKRLKTGTVFIDLSSTYDTVWREALMLKLSKIIPSINPIFKVFLNNKESRWHLTSNGLPQGSILAPLLFNLFVHDLPETDCKIFQYADDSSSHTKT
jgi:hypothetical protein